MNETMQTPRQQQILSHLCFSLEEQNKHYETLIKELNQVLFIIFFENLHFNCAKKIINKMRIEI